MAKVIANISKNATQDEIKAALKKLDSLKKKKNIAKHFGMLKRGIDGLAFQKNSRDEWN